MAELKDFSSSLAIVVSSCDKFFDAWRPFAFFFRKFWPDCPFPVYLIVNRLHARSNWVRAINVGKDKGWASNMDRALREIAALRPNIKLRNDSVRADVLRATALSKIGNKNAACAVIKPFESRVVPVKDSLAIESVKSESGCPPTE